jgi:hypothetical protein
MSESLGLSLGVANLVAARVGSTPVARKSVLTVYDRRASEVGLPEENPNLTESGLVMRGFIERVGDRAPLVAADGTKYLGEALTVEALEAMARTVGDGTPVTIAVPAYWSKGQVAALRDEFFAQPTLAQNGLPPVLISDATAALTALRAKPGFPADGIVVLCDFGASGTSVTLTNAAANFQQVGPSVRYTDFSGDAIDQLILNHLQATAPNRLLGECQRAKENLSAATIATIPTDSGEEVRLSRTEFEQLISEPLDRLVRTVEGILQRNGIPRSNLAAVAIVGGGASIPLLTTRLSGRLQVAILTTPEPAYSAAIGAAVLGQQQLSAAAATAAGPLVENPTETVATAPGVDMPPVAWSEDAGAEEPVPYTGPEHTGDYGRDTTGFGGADDDRYAAQAARLPWYKRTALVLSVAGAGAAVLIAVVLALTLGHTNNTPPNQPEPPQTSQTVTVTGPNNSPTVTVIPPPPNTNTTQPPATTTTNQPPTTTSTASPTTTSQVTTTAPSTTTHERPSPPRPTPPFRP